MSIYTEGIHTNIFVLISETYLELQIYEYLPSIRVFK